MNRATCRLAEPAGDWVAGVREVVPGSAELAWVVMDFLALGVSLLNRSYCSHLP